MLRRLFPPRDEWEALCRRPIQDPTELLAVVRPIVESVKARGDEALIELTERFDRVRLASLEITEKELSAADREVPSELRDAIVKAASNIHAFHASQRSAGEAVETMPGVICWRRWSAVQRVGLYVPAGTAPLFSTLLMLAVPARVAGCDEVIVCTPPGPDGQISPAMRYAASIAGVTRMFRVGGAQAIAALAYGTESIPRVDKILGPGNQYVQAAKQLVNASGVGIDLPAGPSEVLVIADGTSNPRFVAADLLAQAEHGADSQVVLVSLSKEMSGKVDAEIERQLADLPRKEIAAAALAKSIHINPGTLDEAVAFSDTYAPEHLIIASAEAERAAELIRNAGSVFIGSLTPESAGDYASGTNHTLPTAGFARSSGGVSLETFAKKITFQQLSEAGVRSLSPVVEAMAAGEGLDGHRRAMALRREFLEGRRS